MSDTTGLNKGCLVHYDDRHIQVRWDFFQLCAYDKSEYNHGKCRDEPNQECMAKILRLLETLTNHKRIEWDLKATAAKEKGLNIPNKPSVFFIRLSYETICNLLYNTYGESTVRKSIAVLLKWDYIMVRQEKKNATPTYALNIQVLQEALKKQAEKGLDSEVLNVTPEENESEQVLNVTAEGVKVTSEVLNLNGSGVNVTPYNNVVRSAYEKEDNTSLSQQQSDTPSFQKEEKGTSLTEKTSPLQQTESTEKPSSTRTNVSSSKQKNLPAQRNTTRRAAKEPHQYTLEESQALEAYNKTLFSPLTENQMQANVKAFQEMVRIITNSNGKMTYDDITLVANFMKQEKKFDGKTPVWNGITPSLVASQLQAKCEAARKYAKKQQAPGNKIGDDGIPRNEQGQTYLEQCEESTQYTLVSAYIEKAQKDGITYWDLFERHTFLKQPNVPREYLERKLQEAGMPLSSAS